MRYDDKDYPTPSLCRSTFHARLHDGIAHLFREIKLFSAHLTKLHISTVSAEDACCQPQCKIYAFMSDHDIHDLPPGLRLFHNVCFINLQAYHATVKGKSGT
jgi:hypothetical protein